MTKTYTDAGAGSGKTYKLTTDLAIRVAAGLKPLRVILTTFTEAAAAELRERARKELIAAGKMDEAEEITGAMINTVHGVALQFIQKYWYLIDNSPKADVISDEDKTRIITEIIADNITEDQQKSIEEYENIYGLEYGDSGWQKSVKEVIDKMNGFGIIDIEKCRKASKKRIKEIFNGSKINIELTKEFIGKYRDYCEKNIDKKDREKYIKNLDLDKLTIKDADTIYEYAENPGGRGKKPTEFRNSFSCDYDTVLRQLSDNVVSKDWIKPQEKVIDTIFDIVKAVLEKYAERKKEEQVIDYNDMEMQFLELLDKKEVQDEIRKNYDLLMIDEFQDSNRVQVLIFEKLSSLIENTEIVGDPKQAIYGFRGTDIKLVNEVRNRYLGGKEGRKRGDSLNESWRSRSELVELVNTIFKTAFLPEIKSEEVALRPHRKEEEGLGKAIKHWHSKSNKADSCRLVAKRIRKMIEEGELMVKDKKSETLRKAEYGDVAVLCRTTSDVESIEKALLKERVPVATTEKNKLQRAEVQLIINLLAYIEEPTNRCTKANLKMLLKEEQTVEKIIEELLEEGEEKKRIDSLRKEDEEENEEYKNQINQFYNQISEEDEELSVLRKSVKDLPISVMVSQIIERMNLYEEIKKWGDESIRRQNLYVVQEAAEAYEKLTVRRGLGTSIGGFVNYLTGYQSEIDLDNTTNQVKVITYHKSKGLEWPIVILFSLDNDIASEKNIIDKSIFGENIMEEGDEYTVTYTPPFKKKGSKNNCPEPIQERIKELSIFEETIRKVGEEEIRLLYVGMTRARDYIITLSHENRGKFADMLWLKKLGLQKGNDNEIVWNGSSENRIISEWETLETEEPDNEDQETEKYARCEKPEIKEGKREKKNISPSKLKLGDEENQLIGKIEIIGEERSIKLNKIDNSEMDAVGTCIHNIFAAYDPEAIESDMEEMARKVIERHGFTDRINTPSGVISSIKQLYHHLTKEYGEPKKIYHEVPFFLKKDGQTIHGEIDLIWETEEHRILLDFKNYPGKIEEIKGEGEHSAKKYAPQLKAYKEAMTAAGKNPDKVLIYYAIIGAVVELIL